APTARSSATIDRLRRTGREAGGRQPPCRPPASSDFSHPRGSPMNAAHFPRAAAGLVLLAASLAGCTAGKAAVPVSGQLLENGKHLAGPTQGLPPGDKGVRVNFVGVVPAGEVPANYFANIDPEAGTFTVPGETGRGIPPGKYRVSVSVGPMG